MIRNIVRSRLFIAGLAVLALGVGPLLLIILFAKLGLTRDPNPNPVGPGILAMLSFWPGVGLVVAGVVKELLSGRRGR